MPRRKDKASAIVLCNNLKRIRVEKNLSQDELAAKVGVDRMTISSIETGRFEPTCKLAFEIALVLNVSIVDLFYLDSAENVLAKKEELHETCRVKRNR